MRLSRRTLLKGVAAAAAALGIGATPASKAPPEPPTPEPFDPFAIEGKNFYISLHTGPPGKNLANECDYAGYERVPVPRTDEYWDVRGVGASNRQEILFPRARTTQRKTVTHFCISTEAGAPLFVGRVGKKKKKRPRVIKIESGDAPFIAPGLIVVSYANGAC